MDAGATKLLGIGGRGKFSLLLFEEVLELLVLAFKPKCTNFDEFDAKMGNIIHS